MHPKSKFLDRTNRMTSWQSGGRKCQLQGCVRLHVCMGESACMHVHGNVRAQLLISLGPFLILSSDATSGYAKGRPKRREASAGTMRSPHLADSGFILCTLTV